MKIMFLKMTFFGKPVLPGDFLDVSEADGSRLVSKGIAAKVEEDEPGQINETESEPVFEPESIEDMTTKELFALCKEQNLELEKKMINGKTDKEKKEYLLSVLSQAEG